MLVPNNVAVSSNTAVSNNIVFSNNMAVSNNMDVSSNMAVHIVHLHQYARLQQYGHQQYARLQLRIKSQYVRSASHNVKQTEGFEHQYGHYLPLSSCDTHRAPGRSTNMADTSMTYSEILFFR